jgi:RimJ/RimL family protein N-acetyltransferase
MTLDTPRLTMRPPIERDVEPLHAIHADPDVVPYVHFGSKQGITGAWISIATILGHWQLRGYGQWTVVEKATGEVIGRVGLWNPAGWPGIELGWVIKRSRWRHGFAKESTSAALEWTWAHVKTNRVISIIEKDNLPSLALASAIGFTFEEATMLYGEDVHVYSIARSSERVSSG